MMNKEEILRKIGNILQELNEQHQYLSTNEHVNILELELFTANADFLLDHIEIFKKLNEREHTLQLPENSEPQVQNQYTEEVPNNETQAAASYTEPAIEEPVKEEESVKFKFDFPEPTEMIFDYEKDMELEEVFDRELSNEEQDVIDKLKQTEEAEEKDLPQDIVVEREVIEVEEENYSELDEVFEPETGDLLPKTEEPILKEEILDTPPEPVISSEIPKTEIKIQSLFNTPQEEPKPVHEPTVTSPVREEPERKMSLNEMLSAQRNASAFSKPIADLKSAISLNDKMIFIKDLFNGYNLAYSEAIEILNRFDSFEAADNFLMKNYAVKNNWAEKQAVVDRLYEILNRKFKN
ncbi:hypothetical protein [Pseudopedobacter sp.]|uniref:hypothetical protein n=1 Tax=Pseudopedobacter sp. TaxID=1936787 RepID=UPI00333E4E77